MLAQAYAWALRRAFKFLLKRALGRFLRDDLDAEQLDVALGSGVFEIRDAALDRAALDQLLAAGNAAIPARVRSARVGRLRVTVPWHSLGAKPVEVDVGGVRLALAPDDGTAGRDPPTTTTTTRNDDRPRTVAKAGTRPASTPARSPPRLPHPPPRRISSPARSRASSEACACAWRTPRCASTPGAPPRGSRRRRDVRRPRRRRRRAKKKTRRRGRRDGRTRGADEDDGRHGRDGPRRRGVRSRPRLRRRGGGGGEGGGAAEASRWRVVVGGGRAAAAAAAAAGAEAEEAIDAASGAYLEDRSERSRCVVTVRRSWLGEANRAAREPPRRERVRVAFASRSFATVDADAERAEALREVADAFFVRTTERRERDEREGDREREGGSGGGDGGARRVEDAFASPEGSSFASPDEGSLSFASPAASLVRSLAGDAEFEREAWFREFRTLEASRRLEEETNRRRAGREQRPDGGPVPVPSTTDRAFALDVPLASVTLRYRAAGSRPDSEGRDSEEASSPPGGTGYFRLRVSRGSATIASDPAGGPGAYSLVAALGAVAADEAARADALAAEEARAALARDARRGASPRGGGPGGRAGSTARTPPSSKASENVRGFEGGSKRPALRVVVEIVHQAPRRRFGSRRAGRAGGARR